MLISGIVDILGSRPFSNFCWRGGRRDWLTMGQVNLNRIGALNGRWTRDGFDGAQLNLDLILVGAVLTFAQLNHNCIAALRERWSGGGRR